MASGIEESLLCRVPDDSGANLDDYSYDSFGRVEHHWWKDSSGTLVAGWTDGYERVGNKEYREDLKEATESKLYSYEGVYRLDDFEPGQLNSSKHDIANPIRRQMWRLEQLGNWDETTIDGATETRSQNSVNELTGRRKPDRSPLQRRGKPDPERLLGRGLQTRLRLQLSPD